MNLSIQGGMSPEDIISFIQEHTEGYAALVKTEMQDAEDRTQLMKDIADLASTLQRSKAEGDDNTKNSNMTKWQTAHDAITKFQKAHPDFPMDLNGMASATGQWAHNGSLQSSGQVEEGVDTTSTNGDVDKWVSDLTNYKDKIAGDDKIGMMTLQEDSSRMKDLYELGSNLLAKGDQAGNVLISNIKG